MINSYKYQQVK